VLAQAFIASCGGSRIALANRLQFCSMTEWHTCAARYAFILPDQIARGELRPLRDPQNTDNEG
jgi:hypothetical protein